MQRVLAQRKCALRSSLQICHVRSGGKKNPGRQSKCDWPERIGADHANGGTDMASVSSSRICAAKELWKSMPAKVRLVRRSWRPSSEAFHFPRRELPPGAYPLWPSSGTIEWGRIERPAHTSQRLTSQFAIDGKNDQAPSDGSGATR